MRRSKASSQGKGDGERKSNGGTEMSSDSSPSSITPGGEKRSKGGMMRGGGLQSRIPNRRQSVMNRIFGRGVVLMVRRGSYGRLFWFVSVMGLLWVILSYLIFLGVFVSVSFLIIGIYALSVQYDDVPLLLWSHVLPCTGGGVV